jgi:hypothetical protein
VAAQHIGRVECGGRGWPGQGWGTGALQVRCNAAVEHVGIAAVAQGGEQGPQAGGSLLRRQVLPAAETTQGAAQAADAHTQLVHMFHPQRRIAFQQPDGVVCELGHTFVHGGRRCGDDPVRAGHNRHPCLAQGRVEQALRQLHASIGQCAGFDDQFEAADPAFGQRVQGLGRPRQQPHLQVTQPLLKGAGAQGAFVQADLDRGRGAAQGLDGAPAVAAEGFDRRGHLCPGATQQTQQPIPQGRASMPPGVRRCQWGHQGLVFGRRRRTRQNEGRAQMLDPMLSLMVQPPLHAGVCEAVVWRVQENAEDREVSGRAAASGGPVQLGRHGGSGAGRNSESEHRGAVVSV